MNVTILPGEPGQLAVTGALTFRTVAACRVQGEDSMKRLARPVFEFSGVTSSDSAALALLLAWQRHAALLGKPIRFIHLPTQLRDIARLSGVESLLAIA